jgi:hypothetical protein
MLALRLLHRSFSTSISALSPLQVTTGSVHPLSLHYAKQCLYKKYGGFLSMQACAAGYALTYVTTLKLQLVS